MTIPFFACAGVCDDYAKHAANLGSTFTMRLTAVMLVTETKQSR